MMRELSPAQEAGFELAARTLDGVTGVAFLDRPPAERVEAMQTIAAIANVIRNYPHVLLELTTHA